MQTTDGSDTLQLKDSGITYHSTFGAMQESKHIFIDAGFNFILQKNNNPIHILEVGFGTGLNALLTCIHPHQKPVFYHAIEPNPLGNEIFERINYGKLLNEQDLFLKLHNITSNEIVNISSSFILQKSITTLQNFTSTQKFDLVYYDAFAPLHQSELWTQAIFEKIFFMMNEEGVLVTYCSKGSVQRALKHVGFKVEKLKGPAKKREIIRALK